MLVEDANHAKYLLRNGYLKNGARRDQLEGALYGFVAAYQLSQGDGQQIEVWGQRAHVCYGLLKNALDEACAYTRPKRDGNMTTRGDAFYLHLDGGAVDSPEQLYDE